jgi:hypothetical protein
VSVYMYICIYFVTFEHMFMSTYIHMKYFQIFLQFDTDKDGYVICMYICIYIFTCSYTYTYMYTYIYIYTYIYTYIYIHIYIYITYRFLSGQEAASVFGKSGLDVYLYIYTYINILIFYIHIH